MKAAVKRYFLKSIPTPGPLRTFILAHKPLSLRTPCLPVLPRRIGNHLAAADVPQPKQK